jgi:hypothetical protein
LVLVVIGGGGGWVHLFQILFFAKLVVSIVRVLGTMCSAMVVFVAAVLK